MMILAHSPHNFRFSFILQVHAGVWISNRDAKLKILCT